MNELQSKFNNSSASAQKGQKLQSTVRFESQMYSEVQRVSETEGISFAEAVRRLVEEGLENIRGGRQ